MNPVRSLVLAIMIMIAPGSVRAQSAVTVGVSVDRGKSATAPSLPGLRIPVRDSAWWVPLASGVIPGYGQILLGQDRFVPYLAVEAYALAGYMSRKATFIRERSRYQALARDIARAFVPGSEALGTWDYYEAMEKHLESGVYNRTPGTGPFSPEIDTSTFNGAIWLKARQLSQWPNPNIEPDRASAPYRAAMAFYATHAVTPEYRWTWRNAQLEWDQYRQSIRRGNDASREARHYIAAVAVNHVLSMLDAFVTLRLRGGVGAPRGTFELTGYLPIR